MTMKTYLSKTITCALLLTSLQSWAGFSVFEDKEYPIDAFRSPVQFPISLAGNYGECRPHHFHSGLDIRTEQVENKPVYTIAPGYVSRIQISHKGFGNALYINHAGGYTSLYAHLRKYSKRIEDFVKMLQYYNQRWDIDVYLPYWMLLVETDEEVARSGNTGSSLAPHLHFEMRDTRTQSTLNPWLFGFEIADTVAPTVQGLSIYTLDADRFFYNQETKYISKLGTGPAHRLTETIETEAQVVGFGLMSQDYMNDHHGKLGVFETQLYVDDELYFAWQLNDIHYDETRYIYSFTDYPMYKKKNKWYQYIFKLPGDQLRIFQDPKDKNGYLSLKEGKEHKVVIKQYDVKGNETSVSFRIKRIKNARPKAPECTGHILQPDVNNRILLADFKVIFPEQAFYASLCVQAAKTQNNFYIGEEKYPVQDYFKMYFENVETSENTKYVVERLSVSDTVLETQACRIDEGMLMCDGYREMGKYRLSQDHTPPQVTANISTGASLSAGSLIKIQAEDKATELKSFEVRANDKWLCFIRKKNEYYYIVDNYCPRGNVNLAIKATDASGNTQSKNIKINIQ